MGKLGVVIVAAGKGSRMGTEVSKQFLPIAGMPVVIHTLLVFEKMVEVSEIILVTSERDVYYCRELVRQYRLSKVTEVVAGGEERQHSVYCGLNQLSEQVEWVMVHDGVRPFVTPDQVRACLRKAKQTGTAVLAVPVKDTIKMADESGMVQSTIDRRSLWAIQTPQAFRVSDLMNAHERAAEEGFLGTDDAMLVEYCGGDVYLVEGSYSNIKLTTPEDLDFAEWHIQRMGENAQ